MVLRLFENYLVVRICYLLSVNLNADGVIQYGPERVNYGSPRLSRQKK